MTSILNVSNCSSEALHVNDTCNVEMPALDLSLAGRFVARIIALSIVGVFGLLASIFVFWYLYNSSTRKGIKLTRLQNLVFSLIATNTLIILISIPQDIIWHITVEWRGGTFLCKTLQLCKVWFNLQSTFLILSMGLDRCLNLNFPLARRVSNNFKLRFLIGGSLGLAFICAIPQFIVYRNEEIPGLEGHFQCTTMLTIAVKMHKDIYNGVYAVLHFLIPLIVTVVCYSSIVIQLTAKAKQHESQSRGVNAPKKRMFLTVEGLRRHPEEGNTSHTHSHHNQNGAAAAALSTPQFMNRAHGNKSGGKGPVAGGNPGRANSFALSAQDRSGGGGSSSAVVATSILSQRKLPIARNKMLKMTIAVATLFILTSSPYYISLYFLSNSMQDRIAGWVVEIIQVLQYSHCVCDPLCYWFFALRTRRPPASNPAAHFQKTNRPIQLPYRGGSDLSDKMGLETKHTQMCHMSASAADHRFGANSNSSRVPEQHTCRVDVMFDQEV